MPLSAPALDNPVEPYRVLDRGLLTEGHDPALVSANGTWAWRDLDLASDRLAGNLLGLVRPGDRVASLMPNRDVLHYLACLKAGFVATPLNYRYTSCEMDHATLVDQAPPANQWLHEIKFDVYRTALRLDAGAARMLTRSGLH